MDETSKSGRSLIGENGAEADSGDVNFKEMYAAYRREVFQQLEALGILRDLRPAQRDGLADVVVKISALYEHWQRFPEAEKWLRVDSKLGPGQRRMFKRKVEDAVEAVNRALEYVARVRQRNELGGGALGFPALCLHEAQTALRTIALTWNQSGEAKSERFTDFGKSSFSNPRPEATAALTAFLGTCGLGHYESDRLIGVIGNHFGWWRVAIDDEYAGGSPGAPGSSAIRKRRTRRTRRDASGKSNR